MNSRSNNLSILKKYFFVIFFSVAIAISPFQAKPADAWLEMPGQFLKQALEVLYKQIQGIIMGAAKQAAAQSILQQVSSIVGGSGGSGPMFITDYRDFLVIQSLNEANVFINDFISQTTSLRNSTNYEGFDNSGNVGSYMRQLSTLGRRATSESPIPQISYRGDPLKMFANGSFKNMTSYLSGINNPWAYELIVKKNYRSRIAESTFVRQTTSDSGLGFLGAQQNGKIITPGSLTKDIMANAQDLGNKIIAGASNIPEVITSIVTSAVTQSLQNGIGSSKSYTENKSAEENKNSSGSTNTDLNAISNALKNYTSYDSAQTAAENTALDKKTYCAGDNKNDPICK